MQIEPSKIIYSKRKTLCLQITREGEFIVRAPKRTSTHFIQNFILQKQDWIYNSILKITNKIQNTPKHNYTPEQIKQFKIEARKTLFERLNYWSQVMNLKYTKFRLSSAKTRWGSCSGRDVISLNWRLILTNIDLIDYVVIHELSHVKQKNHSDKFWALVEKYDPQYKLHRKSLKESQALILI